MRKLLFIRVSLQVILLILFIAWILLSALYIRSMNTPAAMNWIIMALMLADSILFIVFAFLVSKKRKIIFIFLIIFLLVNTILTFTDQMGIYDWIILFLNVAALSLSAIMAAARTRLS